jgi:hypothetical protein
MPIGRNHPLRYEMALARRRIGAPIPLGVVCRGGREGGRHCGTRNEQSSSRYGEKQLFHDDSPSRIDLTPPWCALVVIARIRANTCAPNHSENERWILRAAPRRNKLDISTPYDISRRPPRIPRSGTWLAGSSSRQGRRSRSCDGGAADCVGRIRHWPHHCGERAFELIQIVYWNRDQLQAEGWIWSGISRNCVKGVALQNDDPALV